VAATGSGAGDENKEKDQPSNCYFWARNRLGFVDSCKDLLITLEVYIGTKKFIRSVFRLGINKTWDSKWFANKEYSDFVFEDFNIRKFLKKKLLQAGVSKIEIERAANKVRIRIYAARPGIIIGKKGVEN